MKSKYLCNRLLDSAGYTLKLQIIFALKALAINVAGDFGLVECGALAYHG